MAKRFPGSLERRGDSYRVRLCIGGERHYITVKTSDRKVAERRAREHYRELERLQARRDAGLPDTIRMSALLNLFETQELPTLARGTQRSYRDSLKPIRQFFVEMLADPPVTNIRAKDVTAFLAWRRVHRLRGYTPIHNRTLQKDRTVLHRIFAVAERLEYRDGNPVQRVRPPRADRRAPVILSDDKYEQLLAACEGHPMLRLYVLTLGETGMRCESEALRLRWDDVDLENGFIQIVSGRDGHRTKTGKSRWAPMTPRLHQAMRDHFAAFHFATYDGRRSPWVFHHLTTRRHHRAGARIGSLRNGVLRAARRAHLPTSFHQHDLRHRRITTWIAEGRNVALVKEAVGHSDLRTTMWYTHLAKEHLRTLVAHSSAEQLAAAR